MAQIPFYKYHGAGNDFIMVDDREGVWEPMVNEAWIALACHRRYGIGADGMIFLQRGEDGADFFMRYYNSDGRTSTFCGNGGRCIVAFAAALGVIGDRCRFLGTDGWHEGTILDNGWVQISMKDVHAVQEAGADALVLHTGSPHYVAFREAIGDLDVFREGRAIRTSAPFAAEGINVNFVETIHPGKIRIRTYERGVEDETLACGTGVVAAAIASAYRTGHPIAEWEVHALGGDLRVNFTRSGDQDFTRVYLTGPAVQVYQGTIPY